MQGTAKTKKDNFSYALQRYFCFHRGDFKNISYFCNGCNHQDQGDPSKLGDLDTFGKIQRETEIPLKIERLTIYGQKLTGM